MDFVLDPMLGYLPHYMRLWLSHGPACGSTNSAAFQAEKSRATAGAAIANVAATLAANLQTSRAMYARTDAEQQQALSKAMEI
jgi:hypothetical protein